MLPKERLTRMLAENPKLLKEIGIDPYEVFKGMFEEWEVYEYLKDYGAYAIEERVEEMSDAQVVAALARLTAKHFGRRER